MKKFLLFFIFFLPFQFALNPVAGIDLSIARLLIVFAFLIWIFSSLSKKKITVKNNLITWGLISFLALSFLSIIKAEEISWAIRKFLVFVSIFPLYFLITYYFKKTDFPKIGKIILLSSTITACLGILQFLSQFIWGPRAIFVFWSKYLAKFFLGGAFSQSVIAHPSWWVNVSGKTFLRATSFFPDPHMFSFFLGISLPLTIPFLLKKKMSLRHYVFYGSVAFINFIALLLTFSRGGYLGLLIAGFWLLVWLFKNLSKKQKLLIITASLLLIITILIVNPLRVRLLSIFDLSEGSIAGRIVIWQQAFSIWLNNFWLGVGIGNYSYYLNPLYNYRLPVYAHNTYLDIGVEMGIFALIAWISIFVYAIYKLIKIVNIKLRIQSIALSTSLIYFLTHSFFDTPIYSPRILPFLIIILSLSSILVNNNKHVVTG
jgi:O-antigen ligase